MSNPQPVVKPEPSEVVSLGDEAAALKVLEQSVLGLWEVVNNLTRLRPTKRERYRVTVFGSARTDPDHWVYAAPRWSHVGRLGRMGQQQHAPSRLPSGQPPGFHNSCVLPVRDGYP
jgi:hypothetical protein